MTIIAHRPPQPHTTFAPVCDPWPRACWARWSRVAWAGAIMFGWAVCTAATPPAEDAPRAQESPPAQEEGVFLSRVRQLTFAGRRAGEGYFSQDGRWLVFQSEREAGNPFFQIFLLDLRSGDMERISPGIGKTTCAWLHPDNNRVLFASTHEDPQAAEKQATELQARQTGTEPRYQWDYDEHYDLFEYDRTKKSYTRLTHAAGYDAEGSWSPDGTQWVFASNREAYARPLTEQERLQRERDPSYFMDLYLQTAGDSQPRRLTEEPGYDGGPFFSPDGQRICWRRFTPNGAIAEIMTMKIDGTDVRQVTRMGAVSWAPFYHPSGRYLIFTTNQSHTEGFKNFELYLVGLEGPSTPVRVTYTDGFDGLGAFSPDGRQLAWSSGRQSSAGQASKQSQIFLADWNHDAALQALGLTSSEAIDRSTVAAGGSAAGHGSTVQVARENFQASGAEVSAADIMRHVDYLCRPELAGRRTGTPGSQLASAYVASYLDHLGLAGAGDAGSFFQAFEFTSGVALGPNNRLRVGQETSTLDVDWRPLAFSKTGEVGTAPVVFAGYGIQAPAEGGQGGYDSFVHLPVEGRWVVALRGYPEGVPAERRQHLARYATLRHKAMIVRDLKAHGLILVHGPNSQFREPLVPLEFDGSQSSGSLPVICVSTAVAERWLASAGKELKQVQDLWDGGEPQIGFEFPSLEVAAQIDIRQERRVDRNVLARLSALGGDADTKQIIIIGAHVDHLGTGSGGASLARDDERNAIHFGADDNASGVSAMLEMAQYLVGQQRAGHFQPQRDLVFAAWSGEELGLLGSHHFTKNFTHGASPDSSATSIYPAIAACVNLDMVGRMDKQLILQGIGSSPFWREEIERRNAVLGLPIVLQNDSYLPTDASSFFMRGVPILSAFTGAHSDYHTPRDTPEKLNYEGAAEIARLLTPIVETLATRTDPPEYVSQQAPEQPRRAHLRASLGTVPDYAETDVPGVKLAAVAPNGPAQQAGLQSADIVVELAGKKIENIYDYTFAIEALRVGERVSIVVERQGKRIPLQIEPRSRD